MGTMSVNNSQRDPAEAQIPPAQKRTPEEIRKFLSEVQCLLDTDGSLKPENTRRTLREVRRCFDADWHLREEMERIKADRPDGDQSRPISDSENRAAVDAANVRLGIIYPGQSTIEIMKIGVAIETPDAVAPGDATDVNDAGDSSQIGGASNTPTDEQIMEVILQTKGSTKSNRPNLSRPPAAQSAVGANSETSTSAFDLPCPEEFGIEGDDVERQRQARRRSSRQSPDSRQASYPR